MVGEGRVLCCVPFCRRWRHGRGEFICWEHWKRIPLRRRRAYSRAVAERAPAWLRERRPLPQWMRLRSVRLVDRPRSIEALHRMFDRLKRDAIERGL